MVWGLVLGGCLSSVRSANREHHGGANSRDVVRESVRGDGGLTVPGVSFRWCFGGCPARGWSDEGTCLANIVAQGVCCGLSEWRNGGGMEGCTLGVVWRWRQTVCAWICRSSCCKGVTWRRNGLQWQCLKARTYKCLGESVMKLMLMMKFR